MEFKDKVKDVLDKAGDVAEKTYKTVADKSSKFMEEAKLKIKASDIEDEITATLGEIGVMVYEKYKSGENNKYFHHFFSNVMILLIRLHATFQHYSNWSEFCIRRLKF